MKEIIYLDSDIMNSILAQLDQGLISSYSNEQSTQAETEQISQSESGKKAGFGASLNVNTGALPGGNIGFNSTYGTAGTEGISSSEGFTEGQRDLLNKIFHDYNLNILIKRLEEEKLIIDGNITEGDIIKTKGKFSFYDFDLINKSVNPDIWKSLISWGDKDHSISEKEARRIINKKRNGQNLSKKENENLPDAIKIISDIEGSNNIIEVMKQLNLHSSVTSDLFSELTLMKSNQVIGLLKKNFLRESVSALSFRGESSREVTFLGRIIGVKDKVVNESNIPEFSPEQLNIIPSVMLDILLGSFDILTVGDVLVSPIAIFYESD